MNKTAPEKKAHEVFPHHRADACCGEGGHACAPSHHQIERRAYEIYVADGRSDGKSEQNWSQAEHQLASLETAAHDLAPSK